MCGDLLDFNGVNLDALTETYNMPFYQTYLARWPEFFQKAVGPGGHLMGYGGAPPPPPPRPPPGAPRPLRVPAPRSPRPRPACSRARVWHGAGSLG